MQMVVQMDWVKVKDVQEWLRGKRIERKGEKFNCQIVHPRPPENFTPFSVYHGLQIIQ